MSTFSISFDATKPLAQSANRWMPHSIPIGDGGATSGAPSTNIFTQPKSLAGTGNSASDEQTRIKIAAGLLPASALKAPTKPGSSPPAAASASAASASPPGGATVRVPGVDDLPALTKSLKSVLNKLTAVNFDKLSKQVVDILQSVQTEASLSALVVLLFDKAVLDSFYANIYSMLCAELSTHLKPLNDDANKSFRRFLLNQCQREFEMAGGTLSKRDERESEAELQSRKLKQKQRMLGTIRFIGELYRKDLILQQIMEYCILTLIPSLEWKVPSSAQEAVEKGTSTAEAAALVEQEESDSVEAFCKLLHTVGQKFDSVEKGKKMFDDTIFPKILGATTTAAASPSSADASSEPQKPMPSRLRFMLRDLYELRTQLRWRPRQAATPAVANANKITTTVEMGLGNNGVPVTSSSSSSGGGNQRHNNAGRGAVVSEEESNASSGFSGLYRAARPIPSILLVAAAINSIMAISIISISNATKVGVVAAAPPVRGLAQPVVVRPRPLRRRSAPCMCIMMTTRRTRSCKPP